MNDSSQPADLLIVEDNPYDAELALRVIEQENKNVSATVVRNGAEALDFLFARGQFADSAGASNLKLVLLDLNLPLVSGIEVLKEIKTSAAMRSLPVVILTSSMEERDIQVCYSLGANSYIVKHLNPNEFRHSLKIASQYWLEINQLSRDFGRHSSED
jgi:CheY-like chemotaxis protein